MSNAADGVIVINAGSTSVKGAAFDGSEGSQKIRGRITSEIGRSTDAKSVFGDVLNFLAGRVERVGVVGHRVVHGGDRFSSSVLIDTEVERSLEEMGRLAPLHNPVALSGIRASRDRFPEALHVGVFDTAFHSNRESASTCYALPWGLSEELGLRRYGVHGIAHRSLLEQLARATDRDPGEVNAVTLQLGSGCSACAIREGRSIETSMGFSPLGGIPMSTRCGDLDPGVILELVRRGWSADRLETLLGQQSGMLGIGGNAHMQDLHFASVAGNERASLAIDHFVRSVVATVGAYLTLLEGKGTVVFGGGVGTRASWIRERIAEGLSAWDVEFHVYRNRVRSSGLISTDSSRPVFVFETDEESLIARDAQTFLGGGGT